MRIGDCHGHIMLNVHSREVLIGTVDHTNLVTCIAVQAVSICVIPGKVKNDLQEHTESSNTPKVIHDQYYQDPRCWRTRRDSWRGASVAHATPTNTSRVSFVSVCNKQGVATTTSLRMLVRTPSSIAPGTPV